MISFSGTRFINNSSNSGRTIMSSGIDLIDNSPDRPDRSVEIDFSGAEFDVAFVDEDNPENSGVSEYWVVGDEESSFDFTYITAEIDAIIQDVWVDPVEGVDEGNLSGSIDELRFWTYPKLFSDISSSIKSSANTTANGSF